MNEVNDGVDMAQCEACGEEKPAEDGESVVVYTHRIDGRAVAEDYEWVCRSCLDEAEDAATDRLIAAREWRDYDKWEERATMGIER